MSNPVEVTEQRSAPEGHYSPSKITLYGVRLDSLDFPLTGHGAAPSNARRQHIQIASYISITIPQTGRIRIMPFKEVALIYGYAYQGHCYSFAEPVVLLVDGPSQAAVGCGYGGPLGYLMWSAEKLDTTIQIQFTQDFFEEVVLRRSMGTAKQPVSYHSAMMVSHRGGKLME